MLAPAAMVMVFAACGSSPQKARDDRPAEQTAPAPKKSDDAIVVRKGDRTRTEASYLERSSDENVSIDLKNADLKTVVLPIFKNQVGVWIEYNDKIPRRVTNLTIRDLHWKEALAVLCYMTHMHLVPQEGSRVLEIKDGFEDPHNVLANWRPDKASGPVQPARYGVDPTPTAPPPPSGAYEGGSRPPSASGGNEPDPTDAGKSRGADQIDKVRTGVSTTNSGGR